MGAGPEHRRLAPRTVDRAAERLAVDGDARTRVPPMLPAEAGGGPGKRVGIDLDPDVADAGDAWHLVHTVDPAAPEAVQHRRLRLWIHAWIDVHPVAPQSVAAAQSASRESRRWRRGRPSRGSGPDPRTSPEAAADDGGAPASRR